ncbi:MAG: aminoacyl-tRNA hydrolase [Rhodomicrobium sp.]
MKLVAGLGNPGTKYAGNRHNIGFMAADEIARGYSFGPWKKRFQGLAAEGQIGVEKCLLLKPGTYMNESGRSVGEALRFYKLAIGDVIVIHDELDLQPGMIRVKTGGGNAGHNGLKSISAYIGNEYLRVRLGIGHPGDKSLVTNYVLQDFSKSDQQWLGPLLEGVARGMERLVQGGEAAFLSEALRGPPAVKSVTAASQRSQETAVAQIQVVAAREGGGGSAVSKAVMLPEPGKPAAPQTGDDARSSSRAKAEALAETQPFSKLETAPAKKKDAGLFTRWFRTRIRGGVA